MIGIATDFTACTVLPALADGTPLCEVEEPERRAARLAEAVETPRRAGPGRRINALAAERGEAWAPRYGGKHSSEWEFAKALQVLQEAPDVYERCERWIEAADWIVWQLTGTESRNACTAGYKGIYQDGAYPSARLPRGARTPASPTSPTTRLDTPRRPGGPAPGSAA